MEETGGVFFALVSPNRSISLLRNESSVSVHNFFQVAAIESVTEVAGMRYVCKDCGSGWFSFENCLTHSLNCKQACPFVFVF